MKKKADYFKEMLEGITDVGFNLSDTMITIDFAGGVIIDRFERILDYNRQKITVSAFGKTIVLDGEDMVISGCDKSTINLKGKIHRIELE